MKKRFILVLSVLLAHVCVASDETTLQLGVGVATSTSPYKGISTVTLPLPDIELLYNSAFIEGINLGYNVYDTKTLQIGVILLPTLLGYKSKDSDFLAGMENRTISLEGGLRLKYNFDNSFLSSTISNDISGITDGYTFNAVYNYTLFEAVNSSLSLYAGAEYLSDKKSDYYYGVKAKEATQNRPSYHADGALNPYIGLTQIFAFSKIWSIIANVEYKQWDSTIYKSPIVDDHYQITGYLAVMYSF
jgi:MipA family protein